MVIWKTLGHGVMHLEGMGKKGKKANKKAKKGQIISGCYYENSFDPRGLRKNPRDRPGPHCENSGSAKLPHPPHINHVFF